MVIGFAADGNYNGTTTASTNTSISAGAPFTDNSGNSSCAPIGNELANAAAMDGNGNGNYKDPLFSAYAVPLGNLASPVAGTVAYIWRYNPGNASPAPGWPSEAWSGLDLYTHTLIPGWKKSLVAASLKWGRLVRLRLGVDGISTAPANGVSDTISYFGSTNRFRDLAFAPGGKDMYVIMDKSTTSSGPSAANPVVPACGGCVQKYTFLGYADNAGLSSIPKSIEVTDGTVNTCNTGTTVTIDDDNNSLWVPITGPDGNIMAEINAMGQNLGVITSSFYKKAAGSIRVKGGAHYLDRNITITPAVTSFATPVKVRLYISKAEFDDLDADPLSGITSGIGQLKVLKNSDPCGSAMTAAATLLTPTNTVVSDLQQGANGYVLQVDVTGFSTFYFGTTNATLPLDLLTFSGNLINNKSVLLKWKTENEINTSYFEVQRSADGVNFSNIGNVNANGNTTSAINYQLNDNDAYNQQSLLLYYRLKMVDINGDYKYSNVISITLADITMGGISIMPNPVAKQANVNILTTTAGVVRWKMTDNTGRVVLQNSLDARAGNNSIQINTEKLTPGIYYISVKGDGVNQQAKFLKVK